MHAGAAQAFDAQGNGYVSAHDLLAACAGLGLILSERELNNMAQYTVGGTTTGAIQTKEGQFNYSNFLALLSAGPSAVTKRCAAACDVG
jgi:Ca2+-binding EF-hand superfamily protein